MKLTGSATVQIETNLKASWPSIAQELLKAAELDSLRNSWECIWIDDQNKVIGYVDYGHHRGGDEKKVLEFSAEREANIRAIIAVAKLAGQKYLDLKEVYHRY